MTEAKETGVPAGAIYPPAGGPHEEQVVDCTRAFARGDFGEARKLADLVAGAGEATDEEKAFAAEVIRRIKMDPVALWVGVACVAMFGVILALTM